MSHNGAATRADLIVGLQWGDEGKGRIVDLYAAEYDVVARFGGGDNAGHSIVVGERELVDSPDRVIERSGRRELAFAHEVGGFVDRVGG